MKTDLKFNRWFKGYKEFLKKEYKWTDKAIKSLDKKAFAMYYLDGLSHQETYIEEAIALT